MPRAITEAMSKTAREVEHDRVLRDEYGVYINYVRPVAWQDRTVWALGSSVYFGPTNETFHEFILRVLRESLGEDWLSLQASLPAEKQHFVVRCFAKLGDFLSANADPEALAREGVIGADPNGWVSYLISLAWDVATLLHAGGLPEALLTRLRNADQYQGARYAVAIAAIFARLDCEILFLDEDK